ncbi:peptidase S8 [Actinocatenispora thailandica]|uniref:Peptidase S8 n=2 Tax=Actinocatenispora thailandica TaxID=227318 RepID=A0A7R7DLC8_9ACTN|nr:peptidase S8 [Actinocatenispora thailandica]
MRWTGLAVAVTLLVGATLAIPVRASAAPGCAAPTGVYADAAPWPQGLFGPKRIWRLSTGAGQLVAVVGTGVDAANRQLSGRLADAKAVAGMSDPRHDCDGRGTLAAGMIAARPDAHTTFVGLAPGARLLSVKYTQTTSGGDSEPDPDGLAAAIKAAVAAHASVICVAVPAAHGSGALTDALRDAADADAVVVAPARIGSSDHPVGRSYPTSSPGVLGVAVAGRDGAAASTEDGDYLDVAAPGAGVVGLAAGTGGALGHKWPATDPAAAAGYAAGAAALLRAYQPKLTAAQVVDRITRTATDSGAARDPRLGAGMIDPAAAVGAPLPAHRSSPSPGPTAIPAAVAAVPPSEPYRDLVLVSGLGAPGAALLLLLAVRTVRRGRRRRWRPARQT